MKKHRDPLFAPPRGAPRSRGSTRGPRGRIARFAAIILGLACLAQGCPQGGNDTGGGAIVAENTSPWPCRLTVAIDGVEQVMDVPAGESVTLSLNACPATVALVRQVFEPDGAGVETSFANWAEGTLSRDIHYTCGDQIVIQIGASSTSMATAPAS